MTLHYEGDKAHSCDPKQETWRQGGSGTNNPGQTQQHSAKEFQVSRGTMTTPRRDISSVQIRRLHSSANIKHAGVESTVNIFPIMCFKKIAKSPFSINIDWRCHGECDGPRDVWLLQAEFLALKHASRILEHSSNPARGFSMMEQVRLCAVWPMENWLGFPWTKYRVGTLSKNPTLMV